MHTAGILISVEGGEGAGKSSALQFIANHLKNAKKKVLLTREPGGTPLAEALRNLVLGSNYAEPIYPETELLLMFAGRVQHIREVIIPALQSGQWVVSDRYVDASFAYQGAGRGIDEMKIASLRDWLVNEVMPQRTILLDTPPEIGLARLQGRGHKDRIESEQLNFFERVRAGYLAEAAKYPERFRIIDASLPMDAVHDQLRGILDELLSTY